MDQRLLNICRYTGITKNEDNADEFVVCVNCGGVTHKTLGYARKTTYDLTKNNKVNTETKVIPAEDLQEKTAKRCSHCGDPFDVDLTP